MNTRLARRSLKVVSVLAALCAPVCFARSANAQVHVDVGAEVGVMKRFLSNRQPGASDAGFGPAFELHAHVAVLPMLRVGAYVEHDISPIAGTGSRHITAVGARAKWLPPFVRTEAYYTWAFLGFGYAGTYGPSAHTQVPSASDPTKFVDAFFPASTGSYLDVPLGVGLAYKLRKPWELTFELGTRLGFLHGGDYYNGPLGQANGFPPLASSPQGNDRFALSLSVGINLDL